MSEAEQLKMVQMGVECSSAQLFRTGLVHADPHEGNMMYTDDGRGLELTPWPAIPLDTCFKPGDWPSHFCLP